MINGNLSVRGGSGPGAVATGKRSRPQKSGQDRSDVRLSSSQYIEEAQVAAVLRTLRRVKRRVSLSMVLKLPFRAIQAKYPVGW